MVMSKAFDKVNHGCLLQKLNEFGFRGSLLQWFSSYLMGRYQRVTVLGETSDPLPVSSRVPQGSILGPMLFLIYVNNLPDSVLTSHVAMFADDTKIYKQIESQEDTAYLQADLLAGQLTDITLTAGWDFHFLKVLLAGSEERVLNSNQG